MAVKFRAWVGSPGGGGQALRTDGEIVTLPAKPPESEFVKKDPRAPAGDFVKTSAGTFEPIGRGTARTEFIGEIQDRRNANDIALAARLGARMGAKKQLDTQGLQLGYMPSQEKEMDALRTARATIERDWSEGKINDAQRKEFEEKIWLKQQAILPQMIRKRPSVQDQFNANVVQLPNGTKALYNPAKGTMEPLDVGTKIPYKDWTEGIAAMTEAMSDVDSEGRDIRPDPDAVREAFMENYRAYQEAQGVVGGAPVGPPPGVDEAPRLRTRQDFEQQAKRRLPAKAPVGKAAKAEVDLSKLSESENARLERWLNPDQINWKWVEDRFGSDVRTQLEIIVQSGNKQLVADALRRMKVI